MSIPIVPGEPIPLVVYWFDTTRTDLVVLAQIYDRTPLAPLFTDVAMPYVLGSPGVYSNSSIMMPDTEVVDVRYDVYESDGTTLIMSGAEVFLKPVSGGGGGGGDTPLPPPIAGMVKSSSIITGTVVCE